MDSNNSENSDEYIINYDNLDIKNVYDELIKKTDGKITIDNLKLINNAYTDIKELDNGNKYSKYMRSMYKHNYDNLYQVYMYNHISKNNIICCIDIYEYAILVKDNMIVQCNITSLVINKIPCHIYDILFNPVKKIDVNDSYSIVFAMYSNDDINNFKLIKRDRILINKLLLKYKITESNSEQMMKYLITVLLEK